MGRQTDHSTHTQGCLKCFFVSSFFLNLLLHVKNNWLKGFSTIGKFLSKSLNNTEKNCVVGTITVSECQYIISDFLSGSSNGHDLKHLADLEEYFAHLRTQFGHQLERDKFAEQLVPSAHMGFKLFKNNKQKLLKKHN